MAGINQTLITVPEMHSFEDVRQAFAKALGDLQTSIASQLPITNYQSKRITNVGPPQSADDVVTLKYLQATPVNVQPSSVTVTSTSGNSSGGLSVTTEIPSGTINGTNTLFTVTKQITTLPMPILELNGAVQDPLNAPVDVSFNGTNVVYTAAPETNAKHVIWYWYGGQGGALRARSFTGANALTWGFNSAWVLGGDMSAGVWLKIPSNAISGNSIIFFGNNTSGSNDSYRVQITGSSGAWNILVGHEDTSNNQVNLTFTTAIPNDTWRYIGVSRDNTAKTYSVWAGDGSTLTSFGTQSYTIIPAGVSSSVELAVGEGWPNQTGPSIVTLEEHYIWSRALNSTDHTSAMKGSPSASGIVLQCGMGNNPEVDLSPTAGSGTVTGTTLVVGH